MPLSSAILKQTGLDQLTADQIKRSVHVSNISKNATLKNVSDFFSFCGNIDKQVQEADPDTQGQTQFAVVVLDSESAYSTALLLSNAVIVDAPINVQPYIKVAPLSAATAAAVVAGDGAPAGSNSSADGESSAASSTGGSGPQPAIGSDPNHHSHSASSVVASLIASGYITGENLIQDIRKQATQLDDQTNVSNRLKAAVQFTNAKAKQVDEQLQLTQTLGVLKLGAQTGAQKVNDQVKQTFNVVDDKLKLRENTAVAAQRVKQTADDIKSKALELEPVKQVSGWLTQGWSTLTGAVTGLKQETEAEIQQKRQQPAAAAQRDPFDF